VEGEGKELEKQYNLLVSIVYVLVGLEILLYVLYLLPELSFLDAFSFKLKSIFLYSEHNILYSKLLILFVVIIVNIGNKPKRQIKVNVRSQILLPSILGMLLFFGSLYFYFYDPNYQDVNISTFEWVYIITTLVGTILLHTGFDNISKMIHSNFMDDQHNFENESFQQPKHLIENEYSLNLPMLYYYKKKIRKGWFNLTNPFRGTMVIGLPESGKSYSFIIPFIKQYIRKGFTMLIYDYKYPDLGEIAYYEYLKNKKNNKYKNYKFHVINLSNVEYSRRVNPLDSKYITTLAQAYETAEALVEALKKTKSEGGSDQFFTQSSINLLTALIYFFAKYENGQYSSLPYVLALMNRSYEEILNLLYSNRELESLLSTFNDAYKNKTFKQLDGQVGTLKVNLSKMHNKETSWVFNGNDVDLRINDPKSPSIFIVANSTDTQSVNSATNSLLFNRLSKLLNRKGKIPCGIVVDELPTMYFHKIQNLISTARSNKVAVILGLQEIPQLEEDYGKSVSATITSVVGNVISGAVRNKETLNWLQTLFGKTKQMKKGLSISKTTSVNLNEQMDFLIPANKIADLNTGEVVAKLAMSTEFKNKFQDTHNTYNCKINIDHKQVKKEEAQHQRLPRYYNFGTEQQKNAILMDNFDKINQEIDLIISKTTPF